MATVSMTIRSAGSMPFGGMWPRRRDAAKEEVSEVRWMDYEDCLRGVQEHRFPNCIRLDELEMLKNAWC